MAKKHQERRKNGEASVLAERTLLVEGDTPPSIPEWGEAFLSDPNRYRFYDLFEDLLSSDESFYPFRSLPLSAVSFENYLSRAERLVLWNSSVESVEECIDSWLQELEGIHEGLSEIVKSMVLAFDKERERVCITLLSKSQEGENDRETALGPLKDILSRVDDESRRRFFEILDTKVVPFILDSAAYVHLYTPAGHKYKDDFLFLLPVSYLLQEDEGLRKRAGALFLSPKLFSDALWFLSGESYCSSVWRVHAMVGGSLFLRDPEKEEQLAKDFSMHLPVAHAASSFLVDDLCSFLGYPSPEGVTVKVEEARQRIKEYSDFLLGWLEKAERRMVEEGMRGFSDPASVSFLSGAKSRLSFDLLVKIRSRFYREGEAKKVESILDLVNRMSRTCLPYLLPPEEMARFLKELREEGERTIDARARPFLFSNTFSLWEVVYDGSEESRPPIGIGSLSLFVLSSTYRKQIMNNAWNSMLREMFPHFEGVGGERGDVVRGRERPLLPTKFFEYFKYFDSDRWEEEYPSHTEPDSLKINSLLRCGFSTDPDEYSNFASNEGERFLAAAFSYALGWHNCWSPNLAKRGKVPSVEVPNLLHWLWIAPGVGEDKPPTVTLRYQGCKAEDLLAFKDVYGLAFSSPEMGWRWGNILWSSLACGGITPEEVKKFHRGVKNGYHLPVYPIDAFVAKTLGMSEMDWEDWDLLNLLCFFSGFSGSKFLRERLRRWVEDNGPPSIRNVVAANLQLPQRDRTGLREALEEWNHKKAQGKRVPSKEKVVNDFLRERGYVTRLKERKAIDLPEWEEKVKQMERKAQDAKRRYKRSDVTSKEVSIIPIIEAHVFESPSNWCSRLMGDCSLIGIRDSSLYSPTRSLFPYTRDAKNDERYFEIIDPTRRVLREPRWIKAPPVSFPTEILKHICSLGHWWEKHGVARRSTSLYKEATSPERGEEVEKIIDLFSL